MKIKKAYTLQWKNLTLFMNTTLLVLINTVIWTVITIRWKELRNKNLSAISAFGLMCAGLPLWIATLVYLLLSSDNIVYTSDYFTFVVLWALPVIIGNLGNLFLMKYQTLSELSLYKLGFSTLMGMSADFYFFQTTFSYFTLCGIILFFISGFLLSQSKTKRSYDLSFHIALTILFFLSINTVFQHSMYKSAVMLQTNPIVHAMTSQILVFTIFFFISYRSLKTDIMKKILNYKDFLTFGILIFFYTIIEALLFVKLPVSIILLLSILRLVLFAVYDAKNKDLSLSWQTYIAGVFSLTALILINL
ncbi:hypothetical protein COB57_00330 [Candidatus Peregrinibacteria bacterium]|nr:MAG: hypothetical protein COB57_00330 [Candidatus Peregrinibacteria bacterium]